MHEGADKWIQRVVAAALVALACGLVGLGVALYAPGAKSGPAAVMAR